MIILRKKINDLAKRKWNNIILLKEKKNDDNDGSLNYAD